MINKALKVIRQYHKFKQVELSEELGISKSYLSEIESGKKTVSLDILEKYSSVFDIPVSSLLFFSENMENDKGIPKKFRTVFANKIVQIMEWVVEKNAPKKA